MVRLRGSNSLVDRRGESHTHTLSWTVARYFSSLIALWQLARRLETPRGERSVQAAGSDVGVRAGTATISTGTSRIQRATRHS